MNNKEFTSELSRRLGYTLKDTSELVTSLLSDMTRQLEEGNTISIQGFGTFEVKKKAERISVNPTTNSEVSFKVYPNLRDNSEVNSLLFKIQALKL